jgi:hypothetical protein
MMSCSKQYAEDEVPAYLYIENFTLETNYLKQGTNSSNISDVWVFVNDQTIGVFELPATIPILTEGNQKLSLLAGIKKNGISNNRDDYFFYAPHEINQNFVRRSVDTLRPVITYSEAADFVWQEDFEDLTFRFDTSAASGVKLERTTLATERYEGKASGQIKLNSSNNYFEARSAEKLKLNGGGLPVYLEMNYRCNQAFEIVLWGYLPNAVVNEVQVVVVNSSTERYGSNYNKIYVDLAPAIGYLNQSTDFRIAIVASYDNTNTEGLIFIDNLKIVQ